LYGWLGHSIAEDRRPGLWSAREYCGENDEKGQDGCWNTHENLLLHDARIAPLWATQDTERNRRQNGSTMNKN
jgi:hypothetical protein